MKTIKGVEREGRKGEEKDDGRRRVREKVKGRDGVIEKNM